MSKLDKEFTATLHKREGKGGWTCVLWPESVDYFGAKGPVAGSRFWHRISGSESVNPVPEREHG